MTVKTKFNVDVYACVVHVICGDDVRSSINRLCKKHDPKDKAIDYDPDGFCYRPDGKIENYYIWFDRTNITINTVNHEKSHLTEWILKDRNIKPTGEQRAYLDGLISEKFNAFFEYQSKNIKFK